MKPGEAFNPYRGECGFSPSDVVSSVGPVTVLKTRRKFSDGHKRLYARVVRYWGRKGPCFPSYERLAQDLGRSQRAVKLWMEDLEAFGLIGKRRRGRGEGGNGQSNEYTFL